ncbi:hypothetical protein B0H16DRAFT_1473225 [Mycena metata]|uniref:Novel STAND NTPase 1 domain-containing protein n=1 Tax=Mycena metata TaxID=1033252 RepID=A0AAD7MLV9_9AGAR|nr:hypothetical protein B0H16DRAFT_1473225 [Mycena metata]
MIHLHLKSETAGSLLPSFLDKIAEFTVTLHKIYTFIEIQQDGNKIRQFFRQSEVNKLLKDCHTGLDQAIESFKVQNRFTMLNNVMQIQHEAETMHKALFKIIETLSDGTISDRSSSVFYKKTNGSQLSSSSFSLFPSKPKIFHGRDSELKHIMEVLSKNEPRIAILGGGGMGKTSLARAALNHTDTRTKKQITMRGSERPGQVLWTPPFLRPLQPLSDEPSQQIFKPITDDSHVSKERTQVLAFTENMALAVDLMAHLVDHEGIDNVLTRWKAEKTAALFTGHHRTSNLDASIALSYSSPQITPGARELLRLRSILPDRLSDTELTHSNLPIGNIQACKSVDCNFIGIQGHQEPTPIPCAYKRAHPAVFPSL